MPKNFLLAFVLGASVYSAALLHADEPKSGKSPTPSAAAPSDKATTDEDVKLHGRLPQHYSKLDVSTEQRQKIYKIQASYAAKMDTLEKQLQDLKTQCNAEARTVLTADQQATLDEMIRDRKTKKAKDTKTVDTKADASAPDNTKVTKSAAK